MSLSESNRYFAKWFFGALMAIIVVSLALGAILALNPGIAR